jgi:menaquinone-dependent protoporphyrinogen oxidase
VCGSEGGEDEVAKADARRIQREFLDRHGWAPERTASFAGAIAYTKYNPLVRWVMRRIARKAGGSTDTTRDHEYTDWERVDAFADEIAAFAGR